jgi:hypothetical protein
MIAPYGTCVLKRFLEDLQRERLRIEDAVSPIPS